ncbi:hypothetical protein CABS03_05128 [Colletotrichum abscissum]|uniref:C2H2-type domain-containing protein n=1 Tax=Colletotrichum abscissum TaxID=1671311 RepID=A0A9Q0B8H8_9PEZI|nr:hypothetical protein CABS02_00360 [Colletotrichum abscissum]
MSAKTTAPKASTFQCDHPECGGKPFANQSNVNRHKLAVHGEKTLLPCGKPYTNRSDNIQRHQKTCDGCKGASQTPPASTYDGLATLTAFDPTIQVTEPQQAGIPQSNHVPIYQPTSQHYYQQDHQQPLEGFQQTFQNVYQQSFSQDCQQPLGGYQQSYGYDNQHSYSHGYEQNYQWSSQ